MMAWLARWLAPCLLLAVVVQHLYLVYARDLTPWIGGGFGMYAVTDTHAMRTMSGECLDPAGRPCLLYLPFTGENRFIRGYPNTLIRLKRDPELARRIIDRLFGNGWVRMSAREIASVEGFEDVVHGIPEGRRNKPYYRPLTPSDSEEARAGAVEMTAIRVQMWKLHVDAQEGAVTCETWGQPIERGSWP